MTGWKHVREERPDLAGVSAAELLRQTAGLAGSVRLGTADGRRVWLIGEVPEDVADAADAGAVEEALDRSGLAWKRREDAWLVPAGPCCPRDITVRPQDNGLRVEAVLFGGEERPGEIEALCRYLCRAQLGLRFARCELFGQEIRVAAHMPARGLAHALAGVATAVAHLARDGGALLIAEVAEIYTRFFGGMGEISLSPGRM